MPTEGGPRRLSQPWCGGVLVRCQPGMHDGKRRTPGSVAAVAWESAMTWARRAGEPAHGRSGTIVGGEERWRSGSRGRARRSGRGAQPGDGHADEVGLEVTTPARRRPRAAGACGLLGDVSDRVRTELRMSVRGVEPAAYANPRRGEVVSGQPDHLDRVRRSLLQPSRRADRRPGAGSAPRTSAGGAACRRRAEEAEELRSASA